VSATGIGFSGGDRLEQALADISRRLGGDAGLRVGFLDGSKYPDGTPVAQVVAINEFGAPAAGIPERPAFRNMVEDKSPRWGAQLAGVLKAANYDAGVALERMGQYIGGQLQQSIVDLKDPPNAESTIARKGFDKPLVETGHELNSVGYETTAGAREILPGPAVSFGVKAASGGHTP
jgi:hypothetical protein